MILSTITLNARLCMNNQQDPCKENPILERIQQDIPFNPLAEKSITVSTRTAPISI